LSRHNIYPGYWFSKFIWSTLCCIQNVHSSSYMLHHLGKPIQIWCWCILPTQYELVLIIVRFKVFNGKGWPSWSLTSIFLILWNNTTLFSFFWHLSKINFHSKPVPFPLHQIYTEVCIPLLLLLRTQILFHL
jgi:hypothetical protein